MVPDARVGLQSACDEIVAHRRATGDRREDLLGLLLDARDEGSPLSDAEIRDQVLIFLLAGHETTSTALTYALHLLGRHPEVQRRVRAEVAAIAVVRDLTARDAATLDYTTMTLKATMRLYPSAPFLGRQAVEDDQISGYRMDRHDDETLLTTAEAAGIARVPSKTNSSWQHIGVGPEGFRLRRTRTGVCVCGQSTVDVDGWPADRNTGAMLGTTMSYAEHLTVPTSSGTERTEYSEHESQQRSAGGIPVTGAPQPLLRQPRQDLRVAGGRHGACPGRRSCADGARRVCQIRRSPPRPPPTGREWWSPGRSGAQLIEHGKHAGLGICQRPQGAHPVREGEGSTLRHGRTLPGDPAGLSGGRMDREGDPAPELLAAR